MKITSTDATAVITAHTTMIVSLMLSLSISPSMPLVCPIGFVAAAWSAHLVWGIRIFPGISDVVTNRASCKIRPLRQPLHHKSAIRDCALLHLRNQSRSIAFAWSSLGNMVPVAFNCIFQNSQYRPTAGVCGAIAADRARHAVIKAAPEATRKLSIPWASERARATARRGCPQNDRVVERPQVSDDGADARWFIT